jgi:thymidine kinase
MTTEHIGEARLVINYKEENDKDVPERLSKALGRNDLVILKSRIDHSPCAYFKNGYILVVTYLFPGGTKPTTIQKSEMSNSSTENKKVKCGYVEVVHGPMFSGKSDFVFRELKKHYMAGRSVVLIKSNRDGRYGTGDHEFAASHSGSLFPAQAVEHINQVATTGIDVIGVDEGQFMGPELTRWCHHMATNCGKIIIVACLDTNFRMEPFENVMALMCTAEKNTKLSSICCVCGENAFFTKKLTDSTTEIEVGGSEMYVPTCRSHHSSPLEDTHEYLRRVEGLKKLNRSYDTTTQK